MPQNGPISRMRRREETRGELFPTLPHGKGNRCRWRYNCVAHPKSFTKSTSQTYTIKEIVERFDWETLIIQTPHPRIVAVQKVRQHGLLKWIKLNKGQTKGWMPKVHHRIEGIPPKVKNSKSFVLVEGGVNRSTVKSERDITPIRNRDRSAGKESYSTLKKP